MVRRKEMLVCNPRPISKKTSTKRRRKNSSSKNQDLLQKVMMIQEKLRHSDLNALDLDYISVKLQLVLNKINHSI